MTTEKEITIRALENMRGDDLYRAQYAFKGLTEKQMKENHGESGKTRAQILADYQKHEEKVNRAIALVQKTL